MSSASAGSAAIRAARPAAAASVITPMPTAVPAMWGTVRRNPNVAPDAQSITLLGPGVPELTNEKATSARMAVTARP
jgi:hypothetical protein